MSENLESVSDQETPAGETDVIIIGGPAKFYVTSAGVFMGAWADSPAPDGGIEVPTAPGDAREMWNFDTESWYWPADVLFQIGATREQAWVAAELLVAASQIEMHQDDDPQAIATEAAWRAYRVQLRAWKTGATGFPDIAHRPVEPT